MRTLPIPVVCYSIQMARLKGERTNANLVFAAARDELQQKVQVSEGELKACLLSQLGLLFTSMGAGSVIGAVFVISWLRARFSPDSVTLSANLLIVLAYALMAFVRQVELFFVVAAVAGVGWTLSASELWVAAQRVMPTWARGRVNAAVIMISQGAITLGSVIWGSAAAIVGASSTLFAAAVLFLMGLVLFRRLSINFAGNPDERVSGVLSITEDPRAPTSTALTVLFPS